MYISTIWELIGVPQKSISNDNCELMDAYMELPDRGSLTLEEFLQTCMRARATVDSYQQAIESTDILDY